MVEPLVEGDYYYAEVARVESAGVQPVYSLRVEYTKIGEVGQSQRTGTEDLDVAQLGLIIRF